jgi:hypothetical protein
VGQLIPAIQDFYGTKPGLVAASIKPLNAVQTTIGMVQIAVVTKDVSLLAGHVHNAHSGQYLMEFHVQGALVLTTVMIHIHTITETAVFACQAIGRYLVGVFHVHQVTNGLAFAVHA